LVSFTIAGQQDSNLQKKNVNSVRIINNNIYLAG
jgi:hypothetical protein